MYRNFGFALAAAAIAVASPAVASTVVYQSVSDMSTNKVDGAWCSGCSSSQQTVYDQFTLGSSASISGINLWTYASAGYDAVTSTGYTLSIFDGTRSTLLFSQLVIPLTTLDFRQGIFSQELFLGGSISGLNLNAGTYWAGFHANILGTMGFVGGNGSGVQNVSGTSYNLNDNAGYQLLSNGAVPEPASWALMVGGFGLVGGALRSRRRTAVTFA